MIDCLSLARPFQVDEQGTYSGEFYTFALAGFIRQRGESDACRLVWYSDAPTSTTIYINIPLIYHNDERTSPGVETCWNMLKPIWSERGALNDWCALEFLGNVWSAAGLNRLLYATCLKEGCSCPQLPSQQAGSHAKWCHVWERRLEEWLVHGMRRGIADRKLLYTVYNFLNYSYYLSYLF